MIQPDKFEKIFDSFLLREIEILCNNKIIRKGKLKMVMMKNNIIKLYINSGSTIKIVELYYPFDVKVKDNKIILDYHINKLTKNNLYLKMLIDSYKAEEKSSYFDNNVYINLIK